MSDDSDEAWGDWKGDGTKAPAPKVAPKARPQVGKGKGKDKGNEKGKGKEKGKEKGKDKVGKDKGLDKGKGGPKGGKGNDKAGGGKGKGGKGQESNKAKKARLREEQKKASAQNGSVPAGLSRNARRKARKAEKAEAAQMKSGGPHPSDVYPRDTDLGYGPLSGGGGSSSSGYNTSWQDDHWSYSAPRYDTDHWRADSGYEGQRSYNSWWGDPQQQQQQQQPQKRTTFKQAGEVVGADGKLRRVEEMIIEDDDYDDEEKEREKKRSRRATSIGSSSHDGEEDSQDADDGEGEEEEAEEREVEEEDEEKNVEQEENQNGPAEQITINDDDDHEEDDDKPLQTPAVPAVETVDADSDSDAPLLSKAIGSNKPAESFNNDNNNNSNSNNQSSSNNNINKSSAASSSGPPITPQKSIKVPKTPFGPAPQWTKFGYSSDPIEDWFLSLDEGKGSLRPYIETAQREFDGELYLLALAYVQTTEQSVVRKVDNQVYEALGMKTAGHKIRFAKGINELHNQLQTVKPKVSTVNSEGASTARWEWWSDDGRWKAFDQQDVQLLEKAYQQGQSMFETSDLSFNKGFETVYVFDFSSMEQVNCDTAKCRRIQRTTDPVHVHNISDDEVQ